MPTFDEDRPRKPSVPQPGEVLAELSIDELKSRIEVYRGEIARLQNEIDAKERHRVAADAFFRR